MKLAKLILPAMLAVFSITIANAQTADDIINKHIDAIGGKDKLSQINSVKMDGSMEIMGNDNPYSVVIVNAKALKSTVEFNDQQFVQTYTDTAGWAINPMDGDGSPTPISRQELSAVKYQLFFPDILFNYAANGFKAEFAGTQDSTYNIKITSPDSVISNYFIDTASYFITKIVGSGIMQGSVVDVTSTFSNYQKTDFGVTVPFTTNTDFGGQFSFVSSLKNISINPEVDPKIFAMPTQ